MVNPSAVYPREIANSQSSVDDFIHCCDDESWASVEAWEEDEPYTIPIDIVETVTGELCTFDNRRLYAARNFSPAGYQLLVRWHSFSDIVPEEKLETEAGDVVFWWTESDGLVTHLHVLEVILIQWGLLTSCRCAFQSPSFSLSGMVKEPDVRRNQAAHVPYYKVQGTADSSINNSTTMTSHDGITNLTAAIHSGEMVGLSRSGRSRIMRRKAFNTMVLRNIAGLRVSSYKKIEGQSLEFIAGCDSVRDGTYWQDQELHQLACMRE
jgi:hypothetical protein